MLASCGGNDGIASFECSLAACVRAWNTSIAPTGCEDFLKAIEKGSWNQPVPLVLDTIGLLAMLFALLNLFIIHKLFGKWLGTMLSRASMVQARVKELFLLDSDEKMYRCSILDAIAYRKTPCLEDFHPLKICYPGTTIIAKQVSEDWIQEKESQLYLPIKHPKDRSSMFEVQNIKGSFVSASV
eukprot:TRINITY_DN98695_c0_g1_i1.p1 TRINITY_DN98695_c0_g1~~TRINITY_DN98695_c0_g1_i1.p1  ORF type:complete len:184 (-),score=34.98 TRINITY_DN98695_c0_g1_i1:268-819(-)